MNIINPLGLKQLCHRPTSSEEKSKWLQLASFVNIIETELNDEYIVLYASSDTLFIHSVLMSSEQIDEVTMKDLLNWSGNPYDTWSISCSRVECSVEAPNLFRNESIIYEQLIFGRQLDGVKGYTNYYEVNQKLTHTLGLHYIHEQKAWCKLDDSGDLNEVIKINTYIVDEKTSLKIICIQKSSLAKYATLTKQKLIRMIDYSAYDDPFNVWPDEREPIQIQTAITFGEQVLALPVGGYFRGIQIIPIRISKKEIIEEIWGDSPKEYVELIVNDIKHSCIKSTTCNPAELDNYFKDTGKPLEMSPAFFNPEVLRKYKSDSEKYQINERSIECRGAWYLRSYDINEANQVSTYLVDFNKLPYKEQLHWKQYNEAPKASISQRAYENDFKGEFSDVISAIEKLKKLLSNFNEKRLDWWKLRSVDNLNKLHYPYTPSKDEWAEELLNLDQLVVEGFEESWLKSKARELNIPIENKFRSLKLLEMFLVSKEFEIEHAREIMSVFHDVHNLRSSIKGHASGNSAEQIRKEVLTTFGSFKAHFDNLANRLLESLQIIHDELENKVTEAD